MKIRAIEVYQPCVGGVYHLSGGRSYTYTPVTAKFNAPLAEGGVLLPGTPGLGFTVDRDVPGDPVSRHG